MSSLSSQIRAPALTERLARLLCTLLVGVALVVGATALPSISAARDRVAFSSSVEPGTIVIDARQRKLFFVEDEGVAIRYPIAVPKSSEEWSGSATIIGKYVNPDWAPPWIVKRDHPELPALIRGGAPNNPMGARALTLSRFQVAIHGTTKRMRASIGSAASYRCIRMLNEDVIDLFDRVSVGTPVIMRPWTRPPQSGIGQRVVIVNAREVLGAGRAQRYPTEVVPTRFTARPVAVAASRRIVAQE